MIELVLHNAAVGVEETDTHRTVIFSAKTVDGKDLGITVTVPILKLPAAQLGRVLIGRPIEEDLDQKPDELVIPEGFLLHGGEQAEKGRKAVSIKSKKKKGGK